MKYELKPDEFIKIHDTLDKLFTRAFDLIEKEMNNNHQRWERQFELETKKLKSTPPLSDDFEEYEDSSSEDDSEDNQPIHMAEKKQTTNVEAGKKAWWDLLDEWVVNFDEDGDQPDRGALLRDLSISKKGIYLLQYLQSKQKLTLATYEWIKESQYISDEEESKAYARKLAEHISQCASILFYQISDFLTYPNPLEEE
jgi:hypothetical protein